MVFGLVTDEDGAKFDEEVVFRDGSCVNWGTMDRFNYNFVSLEEFVFTQDVDGVATAVSPTAFGVTLSRRSGSPSNGEADGGQSKQQLTSDAPPRELRQGGWYGWKFVLLASQMALFALF
jgi:hypothetical protein